MTWNTILSPISIECCNEACCLATVKELKVGRMAVCNIFQLKPALNFMQEIVALQEIVAPPKLSIPLSIPTSITSKGWLSLLV